MFHGEIALKSNTPVGAETRVALAGGGGTSPRRIVG